MTIAVVGLLPRDISEENTDFIMVKLTSTLDARCFLI
jgi:hypothetical protein